MPYSTACTTPLSNFEANQNFKNVCETAITIGFKILDDYNKTGDDKIIEEGSGSKSRTKRSSSKSVKDTQRKKAKKNSRKKSKSGAESDDDNLYGTTN
ncbi:MAG: hypothetical protein EZS28_036338 [Streblomastix strix]|uniref:Uncharacterized protein n=1 Tax=Streblomastix strix TaxID=222440 RepID=A0A5J4UC96_9EUKA|nr:MAG: hypothetical protein EZS28_036338 [Streblomastix strix]